MAHYWLEAMVAPEVEAEGREASRKGLAGAPMRITLQGQPPVATSANPVEELADLGVVADQHTRTSLVPEGSAAVVAVSQTLEVQQAQEDLAAAVVARMEELPGRRLRLSAVSKAVSVATMAVAELPPGLPSLLSTAL